MIIPVLDIRGKRLVRPSPSRRQYYTPWRSPMAGGADVHRTLAAMLRLFPFRLVYIADLDCLSGTSRFDPAFYLALRQNFPTVRFWIDAGIGRARDLDGWPDDRFLSPIVAGESLADIKELADIQRHWRDRFILSLDYRKPGRLLGPAGLWQSVRWWPRRLILLALSQVGRCCGPDRSMLTRLRRYLAGERHNHSIVVGGGARHWRDIADMKKAGASGVLAASTLHGQSLGRADIARISRSCPLRV